MMSKTKVKSRRSLKSLLDASKNPIVIVKVGSAVVTNKGEGLANNRVITRVVSQIKNVMDSGISVVLVSSGAIAEGMLKLGWNDRPKEISKLQAAAAVGQVGLIEAYEKEFRAHNLVTAQVLITHEDFSNRKRYLNSKSTLSALLENDVLVVVNENDTVATDEIKVGDNDSLASLIANLVGADLLIILTDQEGLFDKDPHFFQDAVLINSVKASNLKTGTFRNNSNSKFGVGGMRTKVKASTMAARGGISTVIANGFTDNILNKIIEGHEIGTFIISDFPEKNARKTWLSNNLRSCGQLILDSGAVEAVQNFGKSILPIGVVDVTGNFDRGDLVLCLDESGREFAKGLINYSSEECLKIKGFSTREIEFKLGFIQEKELIHRDNLSLTSSSS